MAESEVECFSVVKGAQHSKTEGGIERKKNKNVKLKGKMYLGEFYLQRWVLCRGAKTTGKKTQLI